MTLSGETRVILAPPVRLSELSGQAVLLNLDSQRYFGLNEMGTRMLLVLTASSSLDAAFESLLSEYDVDPAVLRRELCSLVEALAEHGLVVLAGAG